MRSKSCVSAKTIPAENENTNNQQSNKNKDNNESSGEAVETMLATVKQIKESLLTKGKLKSTQKKICSTTLSISINYNTIDIFFIYSLKKTRD